MKLIKSSFGTGSESILQSELKKSNLDCLGLEFKRQELEGYIYSRFKDSPLINMLPPERLEIWKAEYAGSTVRNILFEKEIVNVIRELDLSLIDYIVLNGFAFAEERLAFRTVSTFNNLDIMIKKEEYGSINEILSNHNFIANGKPGDNESLKTESSSTGITKQGISFYKKIGVIPLNLTVFPEPSSDKYNPPSKTDSLAAAFNYFTDHTVQSRFGPVQFKSLDSTAYFAYLLNSYARSKQYSGLKWFAEVCMLVYSCGEKIEWKEAESICEHLGCQRIFYLIRVTVAEIIGTTHPAFRKWNKNESYPLSAEEIYKFKTLLNYPGLIPKYLNRQLLSGDKEQQKLI
jgi:hypothetical protein